MASEAAAAQPKGILRGHKAQVHAAAFVRGNERLLTGDAEGFVVAWDLTIMRPRAVWQAHTTAILGLAGWHRDRIITHGRDNRLIVWQLAERDEPAMSTALPLEQSAEPRPQPWMLHLLEVNTMNFCAFAACPGLSGDSPEKPELLVAVPDTLSSEAVDIFHLPSQHRLHTVKLKGTNGMAMALALFHHGASLALVAAYENGLAAVAFLAEDGVWTTRYQSQPHSQPILSLDLSPGKDYFLTSSADAIVAKHPIPPSGLPVKVGELPPAPAADDTRNDRHLDKPPSLLSQALRGATSPVVEVASRAGQELVTQPLKVINTKHAGQQSLKIRSDGKVFATAGWDSRVRVYSAKTMKEIAVLKWHSVGCYAVAFSNIHSETSSAAGSSAPPSHISAEEREISPESAERSIVPRMLEMTVKERRVKYTETAHWLVAGSKDGRVSLWDIF